MTLLGRARLLTLTAAVVAVLAAAAPAHAATDSRILDASNKIGGQTAGQLLGEEWKQLIELPISDNPVAGNGNPCLWSGSVLILWERPQPTPSECTVPHGTPVFEWTYAAECSNVEGPDFYGLTRTEQIHCAEHWMKSTGTKSVLVRIDDGPWVETNTPAFRAVSKQLTAFLPDPNILGVPGNRQAKFTAVGQVVLIRPLAVGRHTIIVKYVGGYFDGAVNYGIIDVTP